MSNVWNINLESEAFKTSHCESENDNVWNVHEKWSNLWYTAQILYFWRVLAKTLMKNIKYSSCQTVWFFLEQSQCVLDICCTHCRITMFQRLEILSILIVFVRGQCLKKNQKYSQYQLQKDNIFKIWYAFNANCRRTMSLKFEIFSITIAGGQYL